MTNQEYSEVVLPFITKSWDLNNPITKHSEIIGFINKVENVIINQGLDGIGMFNLIQVYHTINLN